MEKQYSSRKTILVVVKCMLAVLCGFIAAHLAETIVGSGFGIDRHSSTAVPLLLVPIVAVFCFIAVLSTPATDIRGRTYWLFFWVAVAWHGIFCFQTNDDALHVAGRGASFGLRFVVDLAVLLFCIMLLYMAIRFLIIRFVRKKT